MTSVGKPNSAFREIGETDLASKGDAFRIGRKGALILQIWCMDPMGGAAPFVGEGENPFRQPLRRMETKNQLS